jgi:signal transduction histidine kinase
VPRGATAAKGKVKTRPRVTEKRRAPDPAASSLNIRLARALEQQAATSEVLRVISASPTEIEPVLDAVAERAAILCKARFARVLLIDGEVLMAHAQYSADGDVVPVTPVPLKQTSITGRATLERRTLHFADIVPLLDSEFPDARENATRTGFRAVLAVPLMREGNAYGAIFMWRREPGLFAPDQVALVETFARQVAIAIDNVRLFKVTKEALEQQTATSNVLKVISRSTFDLQPVLDTVVESAARLCGAEHAHMHRFDGNLLRLAAGFSAVPAMLDYLREHPTPLGPGSISGIAGLERCAIHWHDVLQESGYQYAEAQRLGGYRTILAVPMLASEELLGVIVLWKTRVEPFTDKQIDLVTTFADQAVIAIQNVRLFNELDVRNRDLTEALEQQTATSEILRVISRSPTDAQPVFDTIAAATLKLCMASVALVTKFDGELIHVAALANVDPGGADAIAGIFPRPPSHDNSTARAVLTRNVVVIPDILEDPRYSVRPAALAAGFRSIIAVPLLRDGNPIGAITAGRPQPGQFTETQIALLQTFADQAVIAIENVRLFMELQTRTTELTQSVRELKALGEVGQAVSSTLDLETVLSTIVSRATQLAGVDGGSIYEYDEAREVFQVRATDGLSEALVDAMRAAPIRKGEGLLGRVAITGEPVEIRDIAKAGAYQSRVRERLMAEGHRSLLAVPLLREHHLLGGLAVNRKSAGAFAPSVIELLKTFAAQSALAIQNARLFRELADKSRQLEVASQHKSEFLANMSHELRTPLNAIIGFSEVLYERMFGEINDKQAEYLADILESGRHLLSLINDILDLSKIEAGRMELDPTEFSLPAAIDNTLTLVRERAHRRAIELERKIDEGVGSICADERKVKQVILNLLSNALKFTPEGGRVAVRARAYDGWAEVSVSDTGVGIAAEDQPTVFDEFRQVGSAAKKVEGTGLGLAISRKFIELHGGRIWVTSTLGAGSTFAFTLPSRNATDASA